MRSLASRFAVLATFCCSLFVNAGNGAVYAMLPLIKRRLTGQIAGYRRRLRQCRRRSLPHALFIRFSPRTVLHRRRGFRGRRGVVLIYFFIDEPKGQIAEVMPDGSVTMIDVS